MKPAKELSAQLAARLGPPIDAQGDGRRGGSDYSKLRGIIRTQKDQIQALENEVAHFQTRLHRIEDGHRLELSRLKKEVEYHKRLRQGADQRSYELEDQLSRLRLQQGAARHRGHDEEKDSLIEQSQVLVNKNSELTKKNQMLESQVAQLEELKAALESELNRAWGERDELAEELERILAQQHYRHGRTPAEDDDGDEGYEEGADASGVDGDDPARSAADRQQNVPVEDGQQEQKAGGEQAQVTQQQEQKNAGGKEQ